MGRDEGAKSRAMRLQKIGTTRDSGTGAQTNASKAKTKPCVSLPVRLSTLTIAETGASFRLLADRTPLKRLSRLLVELLRHGR